MCAPQLLQALFDALVAAVDLLRVVDGALALRAWNGESWLGFV
jgi:hypothetical protein